jgi:hypothetical protein
MGTLKTTNIQSISGSGTVTLGTSGETFTVPSGVTVNMSSATQTGVGGANTPMVFAKLGSSQSISNNVDTTVALDTETFDTDSAFNTSTYKFVVPSGKAGKYLVCGSVRRSNFSATRNYIYINTGGGNYVFENGGGGVHQSVTGAVLVDLDVGEEAYLRVYHNNGSTQSISNDGTWFSVMKMIS